MTAEGYIGQEVRELRHIRGLTQQQVADRAVLTARTVQNVEAERYLPRVSSIVKLARALEVPPMYFELRREDA